MFIDETLEQKKLRAELRAYFSTLVTPEVLAVTRNVENGEVYRQVVSQTGRDGGLDIGWSTDSLEPQLLVITPVGEAMRFPSASTSTPLDPSE